MPLRPLRLGDVFGGVLAAVRGNVAATIGLGFLTTAVFLVPLTALGAWVASGDSLAVGTSGAASTLDLPVGALIGSLLPTLGTSFSSVLLAGFLAFVIGQAVLGHRVSAGRTWDGTRPRLLAVVGATLLTALAMLVVVAVALGLPLWLLLLSTGGTPNDGLVIGALMLLGLAGLLAVALVLWLSTRLAFATPAIVLESTGVLGGLRRSWALTSGTPFWRILGIRLLASLVAGVVAQVFALPITILGSVIPLALGDEANIFVWQAVVSGVSSLLTGALTTPFTAGVDGLLYVDQRFRREGLDVEIMRMAALPR